MRRFFFRVTLVVSLGLAVASCFLDATGYCPESRDCSSSSGGSGGSSSSSSGDGGFGGSTSSSSGSGGAGGMTTGTGGSGGSTSSSSGSGGMGGMTSGTGGSGGTGGAPPSCSDQEVTFDNIDQYVLRVFRGGCNEANVVFSNYLNGAISFETGPITLCLQPGDVVVIQVLDIVDSHSVEFTSDVLAPTIVKIRSVNTDTPATYNVMRAFCSTQNGWLSVDPVSFDDDPAVTGYKYSGTDPAVDQSSAFYLKLE